MATLNFPKTNFFHQIKASLVDWVGTHVKNAGPHLHFKLGALVSICLVRYFSFALSTLFLLCMVLFKHLFIDVRLFHCIIVEHILECLVWWHSMSYVGYYFTLGHTLILEFIRSFVDFLTIWSIFLPLRVVILGHIHLSSFLLGHIPFSLNSLS